MQTNWRKYLDKLNQHIMYIKKESGLNIGDWVETTVEHESLSGTFTVGSKVKIIDIDPMRGYSIEDEAGNRILEIGWTV